MKKNEFYGHARKNDEIRHLKKVIPSLSGFHKRVLLQFCFEGLTEAEIAEKEKCDESEVNEALEKIQKKVHGRLQWKSGWEDFFYEMCA